MKSFIRIETGQCDMRGTGRYVIVGLGYYNDFNCYPRGVIYATKRAYVMRGWKKNNT